MGARQLLFMAPAASPSAAPTAPGIPDVVLAAPADAERACTWLNANAIVVLALLICGLVAAIALHVVLQCAIRVTLRTWYGAAGAPPHHETQPPRAVPRHGGRKRAALVHALPCLAYSAALELAGSSRSECAICLAEFARGEQVRVLPRCNHGFHARCIDRWLAARPTCPTCRQPPFAETQRRPPVVVELVRVIVVDDGVSRGVEL